jgi:hypothetical protein
MPMHQLVEQARRDLRTMLMLARVKPIEPGIFWVQRAATVPGSRNATEHMLMYAVDAEPADRPTDAPLPPPVKRTKGLLIKATVAELRAQGLNRDQIAARAQRSRKTVDRYLAEINREAS